MSGFFLVSLALGGAYAVRLFLSEARDFMAWMRAGRTAVPLAVRPVPPSDFEPDWSWPE